MIFSDRIRGVKKETKLPRIRYSTLQLYKDKGGLVLPNLTKYLFAAEIIPIVYWCTPSYVAKGKEIETNIICRIYDILQDNFF